MVNGGQNAGKPLSLVAAVISFRDRPSRVSVREGGACSNLSIRSDSLLGRRNSSRSSSEQEQR